MGVKNLEELAKKLGLSRRTISRVLKNDKNVDGETRIHVLKYLEKEKYFPNIHAASLASKKINAIGLFFPKDIFIDIDFFAVDTIRGVTKAISEKGYQLMIFTKDKFDSGQCLKLYKSKLVGGLILVGIQKNDIEQVAEVKKHQVPVTLLCAYCKGINSFDCDNVKGGYIATRHLIDSGRKRIAFIHGRENWFDAEDRFKGYKKAIAEIGVKFIKEYVEYAYFSYNEAEVAMGKLLALKNPPEAVFAANDRMAIGAIKAIKKAGKKIPEELAVVGFDNIPLCEYFDPSITTVEQPTEDIAYESAKALLNLIASPRKKNPHIRLFEPKLIIRNTT